MDGLDRFIAKLEADHVVEMEREAAGYVIVSRDLETGSLYLVGMYAPAELPEALADAARMDEELHRLHPEGELGWNVIVHRVMPRSVVRPNRRRDQDGS